MSVIESEGLLSELRLCVKNYWIELQGCDDRVSYIELSEKHKETADLFHKLQAQSEVEIFYWSYCSSEIYSKCIDDRAEQFKIKFPASKKIDFLKEEYDILNQKYQFGRLRWYDDLIDPSTELDDHWQPEDFIDEMELSQPDNWSDLEFLDQDKIKNLVFSERSKREFIENEIKEIIGTESLTQLVDLNEGSKILRITYLMELGIIKFLKKKYNIQDKNKIAIIVSALCDMQVTTAQPYINALMNEDVSNKNYPLKPHLVEKVSKKLSESGIDLIEEN